MDSQVRITKDGSPTLYVPHLDETYHSLHGAVSESFHVFIKNGLQFYAERDGLQEIKVLEVGFGTGLNALLSWLFARSSNKKISYTALEPYPLSSEIIHQLQDILDKTEINSSDFNHIHSLAWDQHHAMGGQFTISKLRIKVQDLKAEVPFDVVYFDAFAPSKQPDIWQPQVLQRVRDSMKPGSVLVTYCAQGQFKRNLAGLGFEVQSLAGPPGKKEMTRAILI